MFKEGKKVAGYGNCRYTYIMNKSLYFKIIFLDPWFADLGRN